MQFYNEEQAIRVCLEKPEMIFRLIKEGYLDVVGKILSLDKKIINAVDEDGNSVMMALLSRKSYDLVLKNMKNRQWDVNHQNNIGNTFSHILVTLNYLKVLNILEQLKKNKNFIPNIKNNRGETILDRAVLSNNLCTAMKILDDKRFNNIDVLSFKYMYDKYINNSYYGTYSKINNLEIIVCKMRKKEKLKPNVRKLLNNIFSNMDKIKDDLLINNTNDIELIIDSCI